jgi:hypothetical protein
MPLARLPVLPHYPLRERVVGFGHSSVPVSVDLLFRGLKDRWVIVSMMVMCNDIGIIEHDRRRSGLPNAPVIMEHENSINRGISL